MELAKRWVFSKQLGSKNLWLLRGKPGPKNRAYITEPAPCGTRALYVWYDRSWNFHCESKNLRALKAIGRMEAARRLYV